MWAMIAEILGIPWRAVEAMIWQMGEVEIARRAGTVPFSLSSSVVLDKNKQDPAPSPAGTDLSAPVDSGDQTFNQGQHHAESVKVDKAVQCDLDKR